MRMPGFDPPRRKQGWRERSDPLRSFFRPFHALHAAPCEEPIAEERASSLATRAIWHGSCRSVTTDQLEQDNGPFHCATCPPARRPSRRERRLGTWRRSQCGGLPHQSQDRRLPLPPRRSRPCTQTPNPWPRFAYAFAALPGARPGRPRLRQLCRGKGGGRGARPPWRSGLRAPPGSRQRRDRLRTVSGKIVWGARTAIQVQTRGGSHEACDRPANHRSDRR